VRLVSIREEEMRDLRISFPKRGFFADFLCTIKREDQQSCDGGGGSQCPIEPVIDLKKTGARSAWTCSSAKPLSCINTRREFFVEGC
jgi:hypothetical protein